MNEEQGKTEYLSEDEALSIRERRRAELEQEYSPDDYKVIRKELFAHLRDPAVSIRDGSMTFNTACIRGLEGVVFIELQISEHLGKLTAKPCDENDKNALRWCIAKDGVRKSRIMNCKPFTDLIYKTMGWDKGIRYKMLGYLITYEGKQLYVFDLKVPEQFDIRRRKQVLVEPEDVVEETTEKAIEESLPMTNPRKGFYSEEIANSFGPTVAEYNQQMVITEEDGFVSIGMLTDNGNQTGTDKTAEEEVEENGHGRVPDLEL